MVDYELMKELESSAHQMSDEALVDKLRKLNKRLKDLGRAENMIGCKDSYIQPWSDESHRAFLDSRIASEYRECRRQISQVVDYLKIYGAEAESRNLDLSVNQEVEAPEKEVYSEKRTSWRHIIGRKVRNLF